MHENTKLIIYNNNENKNAIEKLDHTKTKP